MTKDLEQLRLNMIRTLMELDYDSLMKVKVFMENQTEPGWNEYINDENVEFIDYSKISKVSSEKKKNNNIIFL